MSRKLKLNEANPDDGLDKNEVLNKIINLVGPMPIDQYLLNFLKFEILKYSKAEVSILHRQLINLINHSLKLKTVKVCSS